MLPISIVIFTKNEEENLAQCIKSVSNFSEVVVIDSNSSDRTCVIARDCGVRVLNFSWNGTYPKKRQWSLENVNYLNSWILFLDADERVSSKLESELQFFLKVHSAKYSAGSIPIDYSFAGKSLKFGQRPRKVVFLKIGRANFPLIDDLGVDGMGELEGHYQPSIDGKIKRFRAGINHDDNDPISTWMIRHVNYAKWEAHLLMNQDVKNDVDSSKGRAASIFHKLPMRPLVFFVYTYFLRLGFLDGRAGFDYAFAKSWYYWLSRVIAREKSHDVQ